MNTKSESKTKNGVRYPIKYGVREYTFPYADTVEAVRFDDTYMHLELVDGRILLVPLAWIPPLRDASPEDREKYHIGEDRDVVWWDPGEGPVNEIFRISDYLRVRQQS